MFVPVPTTTEVPTSPMGRLRHFLGILSHDKLGAKTLLHAGGFALLMVATFSAAWYTQCQVLVVNGFLLMHRVGSLCAQLAGRLAMSRSISEGLSLSSSSPFTFGMHRVEILAEFAALTLLMVSCLTCVIEGLQKMLEDHDINPAFVELTCVAHIAAVLLYTRTVRQDEISRARRRHGAAGPALLYLTEIASPLICIVSCQLVMWTGYSKLDLFFAMLQTTVIVVNSAESLFRVCSILLNRADPALRAAMDRAMREAEVVEGVLECRGYKFWLLCDGHVVLSVWLRLQQNAHEQRVLRAVSDIVAPLVHHSTIHLEAFGEKRLNLALDIAPSTGGSHDCGATPTTCAAAPHSHSHSHGHASPCCGHGHHHSHEEHPFESHSCDHGGAASYAAAHSSRSNTGPSVPVPAVPLFPVPPPALGGPLQPIDVPSLATPRGRNAFPSPPPPLPPPPPPLSMPAEHVTSHTP